MTVLSVACMIAATLAIDLSDEAQRKAQPQFKAVSYEGSVIKGLFANGEWAYRFHVTKPWCGELPQWPSMNLVPAVTDWSQYDRLVLDLFNDSTGGDNLQLFIAEKEGRIQNGLMARRGMPMRDYGHSRWVFELKDWPKTCDPKKIGRIHFFMTAPMSADVAISTFALLKKGEALPPVSEEFLEKRVKAGERKREELARERRRSSVDAFTSACRAAGQKGDPAWFGSATSMEGVRPCSNFKAKPATTFCLSLARGEYESLQVLVMPNKVDLKGVRVEVSTLKRKRENVRDWISSAPTLSSTAFVVSPVGYVETVNPPPYKSGYCIATNAAPGYFRTKAKTELGWWPDPVLDWLTRADIRQGDVQSFWVRCKCPRDQRAGTYKGEVRISGEGWQRKFPIAVRVYDFEIPKTSPLDLAVTFAPAASGQFATPDELELNRRIYKDKQSPVNAWVNHREEWIDFLGEHFLMLDNLYSNGQVQWDAIERMRACGRLGRFNLGCWNYPADLKDETKAKWIKRMHATYDKNYAKAKELGLLKKAYIYGCDECPTQSFQQIAFGLNELKKAYPGVEMTTTSYDHDFGLKGSVLAKMDGFTPTTDMYDKHFEKVAPSRAAGHRVWWYIACGQQAPRANLFVEGQPIEARQLMGAQAVKYRPDGFLYYQTTLWNSMRPIEGTSTFTKWDPRSWTKFHGDGSWFCCGPDGTPCETIRIENFRDGIEDYAYAMEYERLTGKKCEVGEEIVKSVYQYNDDPAAYYRWRNSIAEAIEKFKR